MHSVTDRRTDGQQAAANSRSYCVAVRSANNNNTNNNQDNVYGAVRVIAIVRHVHAMHAEQRQTAADLRT